MPVENEFKFVMLKESMEEIATSGLFTRDYIMQGYLTEDGSSRIRSIDGDTVFTFKKMCGDNLIEIETNVDPIDAVRLWTHTVGRLNKIRFNLIDISYGKWCVDYLQDSRGNTYFALAEVELAEGQTPGKIPFVISKNIVFTVDKTDKRFYNSRLQNVEYGKILYECVFPWSKS